LEGKVLIEKIEFVMLQLSRMSFSGLFYFLPYLTVLSLVVLFYVIYSGREINSGLYKSFKLEEDGEVLKTFSNDVFLRFENVKSNLLHDSYWMNLLESLGNVSGSKFISVEVKDRGVNLYYDNLPKSVSFSKYATSKPMGVWLGLDSMGKNVNLDFETLSSLYIDGKPGSGKSIAIKTILESYKRSFNASSEIIVNVITTKPADYYELKNEFEFVNIMNPYTRDQTFENVVDGISSLFDIVDDMAIFYENKCKELGKQIENLERMRKEGISVPFPRVIYIFDEAKDYLNKDKSDTKKVSEAKAKLTTTVGNHIRRNARFLSAPIVIASQVQNENDLSIPMKSFTARLYSNTNEALSRQYTGSNILNDMSFKKGKYYLKTDSGGQVLRVAMK
jgi:hypothetical protein